MNEKFTPRFSDFRALNDLGSKFKDLGKFDRAIYCFKNAIKMSGDEWAIYYNIGSSYFKCGQYQKAKHAFTKAIDLDEVNAVSNLDLSLLELLLGEYEQGLRRFEYRFKPEKNRFSLIARPKYPYCNIAELRNNQSQEITIISEGGLGDSIHFGRYIKILLERGYKIKFCVHPKLHKLFKLSSIGVPLLGIDDSEILESRSWLPLMSILNLLEVRPNRILTTKPYLNVPPERYSHWRKSILDGQKLVVGINWHDNRADQKKSTRDVSLQWLESFFNPYEFKLIYLQRKYGCQEKDDRPLPKLINISRIQKKIYEIADSDSAEQFCEYAAVVSACDFIVTTSTTLAHLAGSLGIPTIVIIPIVPEWRWGLESNPCLWYENMLYFYRRANEGEQQESIRMRNTIETFIENHFAKKLLAKSFN